MSSLWEGKVAVTKLGPRGIRNNNPGNLRHSKNAWKGMSNEQTDKDFVQFDSPVMGLRALMRLLIGYDQRGFSTVLAIISRYAPSSENNTTAYVQSVCRETGYRPADVLDFTREETLIKLARAITLHENGDPPPASPAYWYAASEYLAAALLALGLHADPALAMTAAQQRLST